MYSGFINGKNVYRNKTFKSEKEAKDYLAKINNLKVNKTDINISDKALFKVVAQKYLESIADEKGKINTHRQYSSTYNNWIDDYLGLFQIGDINHATISDLFETSKKNGAKKSTISSMTAVLTNIFKYATSPIRRYVLESPMNYISTNKEKIEVKTITKEKYFNEEELEKFLDEAVKTPYYALISFAINTGLRVSELSSITEDSIDFKNKVLYVNDKLARYTGKDSPCGVTYILEDPKSSYSRIIPLNQNAIDAAKMAIKESKGNLYIFCPGDTQVKKIVTQRRPKLIIKNAKYITPKTLYLTLIKIAERAGVRGIGAHGLRHTFSAHFLIAGGDIFALSKILGHSSINTTIKSYGHLSPRFLNNAINNLNIGGKR
jgi:integrase